MAAIKQLSKLLNRSAFKYDIFHKNRIVINARSLNYISRGYDKKNDPSPHFFNRNTQQVLLALTRIDFGKVFCRKKVGTLEDSKYEFLTDEQLKHKFDEMQKQAMKLLQFPPAVAVREPNNVILSNDPALIGYETSKIVFTDITFGKTDKERIIVIRDPDGTLREGDWETRDRMNQVYFPREFRHLKIPHAFKENNLEEILMKEEYIFILDLACQQFEPDDPEYQRVTSITYQYINDNNGFDKLRSTRHFGSMTFFLIWNKMIDNLLLDLIDTCHLDEAINVIELYNKIHKITPDNQNDLIQDFIKNHSTKKAVLELALQSTKDFLQQKQNVEEGIKKAHGLI